MQELKLPVCSIWEASLKEEGLDDLPIARLNGAGPRILIGQDHVELLMTTSARMGKSKKVVGLKTVFGWTAEGQRASRPGTERCMVVVGHDNEEERLEKIVEDYIELENFVLQPDDSVLVDSDADNYAMDWMAH